MLAIVEIPWIHKGKASASHEGALYAALDCIGQGNPALAQSIHDSTDPPPFSAYLDKGKLRLGCLTTDVFLAVAQSKLAHKAERTREDTFQTILARAINKPTLKLIFQSPTCFGRRGRSHLLPEPGLVFGALSRRWLQFGGPDIPELDKEGETAVIALKIQSRKRMLSKYTQYGFTGYALYHLPEDVACWYHALAYFGEYAGLGQRTSQGFGRVRYDQPNY